MEKMDKLFKYLNYLNPNGSFKRLGTIFDTRNNTYFYDSGTGKVFCCENNELLILKFILNPSEKVKNKILNMSEMDINNAIDNILSLIKTENILQMPIYSEFNLPSHSFLYNEVNNNLEHIVLELTERCNLRCKYCIYNEDFSTFRDFSQKEMSWDIAKKSIDYGMECSGENIMLGFYGGEPLLNYDLMKKCIDYAYENYGEKKNISILFTTNCTLITQPIAEYFASLKSCKIMCSIDGDEDIHDENRVFQNNKGSFPASIKGFKYLIEQYGERAAENISIHSVLSPPYTFKKMEKIKNLFVQYEWIPKNLELNCNYVNLSGMDQRTAKEKEENAMKVYRSLWMHERDTKKAWAMNSMCDSSDSYYARQIEKNEILKTHFRDLVDTPIQTLQLNGCCIPGQKKLYVTTDGNFKVCEKIEDSPFIGNIHEGIDLEKIEDYYLNEYANLSLDKCNNCWAVHMCSICYANIYNDEGINIEEKNVLCHGSRANALNRLIEYYQILEEKPEIIEEMIDGVEFDN
ncbi:uncharacterized protein M2475_001924 [Breznakia sp. PF5-3]|uniref:radical SAM protein n=1 Tax=unclassified Breznakia TaxID=2623764 RepID=UPI0024062EDD|nr:MULTISPECIES: radical SAM protein [unclassified Breznakia]MDF9825498.1 uncharacterized protein [Breznakia sp. PM6-1]MDF9836344.1 uncharacterized protein [Breznakia sp. PF5-3]MDF9838192.1 uncharacterized protein [Breznakia sp. PFB2-8]MDF9860215.1 uncharacterized protein [Breznakia sp. PH5-24]